VELARLVADVEYTAGSKKRCLRFVEVLCFVTVASMLWEYIAGS
jgi:hypothetical protein